MLQLGPFSLISARPVGCPQKKASSPICITFSTIFQHQATNIQAPKAVICTILIFRHIYSCLDKKSRFFSNTRHQGPSSPFFYTHILVGLFFRHTHICATHFSSSTYNSKKYFGHQAHLPSNYARIRPRSQVICAWVNEKSRFSCYFDMGLVEMGASSCYFPSGQFDVGASSCYFPRGQM